MKFLALAAILLCSCAGPKMAPQFEKPSVQPVSAAQKQVEKHAKKAQVIVKEIDKDCPQAQALIDKLNAEINSLLQANAQGEGAIKALDSELQQMTDKANAVSKQANEAELTILAKNDAIKRRDKIILALGLLSLGAFVWIFKRPLLLLAGI